MSTSVEFIEYVCQQVSEAGVITNKKMFGEYMVYVNGKPIFVVCDDTVFVKMVDAVSELLKNAETGYPYKGAKPHYVLDIDDKELSLKVATVLEPITPLPKKKTKKAASDSVKQ